MSTSSCSTVNRCASSFARSSTSPTSRSSRSASAAITVSEAARSSSSVTTPSRRASTWPRIAVSGVRSSCETDIRKLRSSSSASESRAAISRKRSASTPISPPPGTSGTADVVAAPGDLVGGRGKLQHGRGDPAGQVPGEEPAATSDPAGEGDQEPLDQREPALVEHGLRLRDDDRRRSVLPPPRSAAEPPPAVSGRPAAGETSKRTNPRWRTTRGLTSPFGGSGRNVGCRCRWPGKMSSPE